MSRVRGPDRAQSPFEVRDFAMFQLARQIHELDYLRHFGFKIRYAKLPKNWEEWSIDSRAGWMLREADRIDRLRKLDESYLEDARRRENGVVEMKILPKTVTRFRKRTRKMKKHVDAGKFTPEYVRNVVRSWLFARQDVMSYPQVRRIELLVLNLYGREAYERVCDQTGRWKAT